MSPPSDAPVLEAEAGLTGLSDAELHERYLECRRRERVAAAEASAALAEIDRRRSFCGEGFLSATAFVAWRAGDSHQTAAGRVRMARSLRQMPVTRAAYERGAIDTVRVRRLIGAHDTAPGAFTDEEESLVERACTDDAGRFAQTVGLWCERRAPEATRDRERAQHERRALTVTETFDGMTRFDALLDPITAETVTTAIGALAGPANRADTDGRTPTQRRVDALGEICRHYLDSGNAPITGGRKPHLQVIVDLDALTGGQATRSEIGRGRYLGPAARAWLACDATVCGVLMEGPLEVLEMGRRARTASPAQLRALAIRDGGCVIPGCDRPPEWCDAHHVVPWTHGGLTDLANLRLVCRPHHFLIHLGILSLPARE